MSEPTKVEEEYDWDELRPLPLDGQGKVVCMTDDKGSGEVLHLRRRGRGRKKRLRKARMEKWKGVELKRSTSMAACKANIREEPRDSVGAQGEQVGQVMAARQGRGVAADVETRRVAGGAKYQEEENLLARTVLPDPGIAIGAKKGTQ